MKRARKEPSNPYPKAKVKVPTNPKTGVTILG